MPPVPKLPDLRLRLASHSCLHWSARMACVSRMRCSTTHRTRSCNPLGFYWDRHGQSHLRRVPLELNGRWGNGPAGQVASR